MHLEKVVILAGAIIGLVACFLPWVGGDETGLSFRGTQFWWGWVCFVLFALLVGLPLAGKKNKPLPRGGVRIGILVLSSLSVLVILSLIIIMAIFPIGSAQIGAYIALSMSVLTLAFPFFVKDSGEVHVPSFEDIAEEIEDDAEVLEDQVEVIEDKVEAGWDKIEDRFDRDDESE